MKVKFTPNRFGRRFFCLEELEYRSDNGLTDLFENLMNEVDYERFMIASDPFCGERKSAPVRIILNRDEVNVEEFEYATIGVVELL